MDPATRRRIERLTTAVREFRRISSTTAFTSRWLGAGADALEGGQYDMLDRLGERETWRMGEIAAALRVDLRQRRGPFPHSSNWGFVRRTRDPHDGRACWSASPTRAGSGKRGLGLRVWSYGTRRCRSLPTTNWRSSRR